MGREHRYLNGQTGELTVVPFTPAEEAIADANTPTLAEAKTKRIDAISAEAMSLYKAYEGSSILLTIGQKNSYYNILKDETNAGITAINALTTVQDVVNYQANFSNP